MEDQETWECPKCEGEDIQMMIFGGGTCTKCGFIGDDESFQKEEK